MGTRTKIRLTSLGEKIFRILHAIESDVAVFKFTSPTAIKAYIRGYNGYYRKQKSYIHQKEIENFIKLLEDNKLIMVERK